MMITGIIAIFLLAAAFPLFLKNEKHIRIGAIVFAFLGSASAIKLIFPYLFASAGVFADDWWRIDAFSAFILGLITFVYLMGVIVSSRYIGHEYEEKIVSLKQVKAYFSLIQLFVLSMAIVVLTNNAIVIWIALEATTLSSTFLVGLYKKRTSIEAAWKYMIICSTGITLGLVGVLFINYSARLFNSSHDVFVLSFLLDNAKTLSPEAIRWAFVFLFVGFGTKVGFVPMHTWLLDAHSKAPSPISAMFSGVLLNVAFYVIIRFKNITDAALGTGVWTNNFFMVFGIMSVLLPAFAMLIQNNYKRMLAYSSIEHMGLIALAVSFPPLGLAASLVHMAGHTLTKSLLFFGAGEFLLKWKTTKVDNIKGLIKSSPYSGILFLFGILAIIATPPFALFASEYMMFSQIFSSNWKLALIILAALSLIAFAMLRLTMILLFGEETENGIKAEKEKWNVVHSVMSFQLLLVFGLAFVLTSPSGLAFIDSIVKIIK